MSFAYFVFYSVAFEVDIARWKNWINNIFKAGLLILIVWHIYLFRTHKGPGGKLFLYLVLNLFIFFSVIVHFGIYVPR